MSKLVRCVLDSSPKWNEITQSICEERGGRRSALTHSVGRTMVVGQGELCQVWSLSSPCKFLAMISRKHATQNKPYSGALYRRARL